MNVTYQCPYEVARDRLINELLDQSDKQINSLLIRRNRTGFAVSADGISDNLHRQIQERISDLTWEIHS